MQSRQRHRNWRTRGVRRDFLFREKRQRRERNETLAGHDHKAEADHCAVAPLEARVKDTLTLIDDKWYSVGRVPLLGGRVARQSYVNETTLLFFSPPLLLDISSTHKRSRREIPYPLSTTVQYPLRISRGTLSDAGRRGAVPVNRD